MTDHMTELLASLDTRLYIDGAWRDASGSATFDVENPATGETLASVSSATSEDALIALDAADRAQERWGSSTPRERADVLHTIYDRVIERTEDLALLMSLEMGKSLAEARGEVTYASDFLRWYAEEALRPRGEYRRSPDGKRRILVTSRPVGPCLLITPWNFPLAMATRKIAPALAAGCTTITKPAKLTPLTTMLLTQIIDEVGVPAGVVNVVPSASASAISKPLMADRRLRKVSFTGSTEVGRVLLEQAAANVLRTSMELGGNAPFLVFADADLDAAVDGAMAAKFRNIGEACTAANRFIVESSVADEFVKRLSAKAAALQVGPGYEEGTDLGPLVEAKAREKVHALVQDAISKGATLHSGGSVPAGAGYFYPATVLSGAGAGADIHVEEIFGPVVSVRAFETEDEAVAMANDSEFGLASYVFTENGARGLRLVERLEYGLVGLNAGVISDAAAPFGGVKQSGMGREGSHDGIGEYLETQYVGIGGV